MSCTQVDATITAVRCRVFAPRECGEVLRAATPTALTQMLFEHIRTDHNYSWDDAQVSAARLMVDAPTAPRAAAFLPLIRFGTSPQEAASEGRRAALEDVHKVVNDQMDPHVFDGYVTDAATGSDNDFNRGYLETVNRLHALLAR